MRAVRQDRLTPYGATPSVVGREKKVERSFGTLRSLYEWYVERARAEGYVPLLGEGEVEQVFSEMGYHYGDAIDAEPLLEELVHPRWYGEPE